MGDPQTITRDRAALGARLAALRVAAGYTQEAFASLCFYGRSSIANIETGRQSAPREFWVRCDRILDTGTTLTSEHEQLTAVAREQRRGSALIARPAGLMAAGPVAGVPALGGWVTGSGTSARGDVLALPAGRFFPGTDLDVRVFPASFDGRVVAQVPTGYGSDPFVTRNRRGLLIGTVHDGCGETLYGIDTRHARRKLSAATAGSRLLIPSAYRLDEVTLALLWATASFDEALLDDDRALAAHVEHLSGPADLQQSMTSLTSASQLSTPTAMWLGSHVCAQHILRNVDTLTQTPAFWTREQRGEEASAWLLFTHKLTYLRQLRHRFADGMTRSFCVPETSVQASTPSERMLLLLVAALMESFDIHCLLTNEPEYSAMDGFVLDAKRRAIVANWVGTTDTWHVDVTDTRAVVREYTDAKGHVRAHSAIADPTPTGRLQALTAYLGLDWHQLTRRAAELADYGLSGLIEPRSRLLSLAGPERACRYLADLATG